MSTFIATASVRWFVRCRGRACGSAPPSVRRRSVRRRSRRTRRRRAARCQTRRPRSSCAFRADSIRDGIARRRRRSARAEPRAVAGLTCAAHVSRTRRAPAARDSARRATHGRHADRVAEREPRLALRRVAETQRRSAHQPRVLAGRHPPDADGAPADLDDGLLARSAARRAQTTGDVVGADLPHRTAVSRAAVRGGPREPRRRHAGAQPLVCSGDSEERNRATRSARHHDS